MIPKEFKETEVRVYKKNRKLSDEKIKKYVTKQRTFNVITYVIHILVEFQFERAFKEWCDHPECTPEKSASQDHHGNPETCRRLDL